jgi:serine/threonine protein kinase/Tol biopolymer transport system component
MKLKLDSEKAKTGCAPRLDPAESGQVEYFYLEPGAPAWTSAGSRSELHTQHAESLQIQPPRPLRNAEALLAAAETHAVVRIAAPALPEQRAEPSGFTIGHYLVERAIGRGGMGDVYLARDTRLGRRVAVKLLRADYHPTEDRVKQFHQEALAVSLLNHPNIVTIHEVGESESGPFIVSEYIEGETLRRLIPKTGMNPARALEIVMQVAHALAAAHQMGTIHRDVKPENVMVRGDGYVKVLDFGLAKLSDALEHRATNDATGSSGARNVVMGTINYMSPEQARGLKVDGRTDVFSLGIVLYELLTGKKPFEGAESHDVLTAILNMEPAPLASFKPSLSIGLQQLINQALRKDRDERYASMAEMIRDMRELKDELALQSRRENRASRSSSRPSAQTQATQTRAPQTKALKSGLQTVSAAPRPEPKRASIGNAGGPISPSRVQAATAAGSKAMAFGVGEPAPTPKPEPRAATASNMAAYFDTAFRLAEKKPERRKIPKALLWLIAGVLLIAAVDLYRKFSLRQSLSSGARIADALDIWIAPAGNPSQARAVTRGTAHHRALSWAPDGSLVADSDGEIRRLSPDGSRSLQVTATGWQYFNPIVTPDGRRLIVQASRDGRSNLWRMEMDESNAVQLTRGDADNQPQLSPDGKWVFYESLTSGAAGRWTIWKVTVEGGAASPVVAGAGSDFHSPAVSPDGQWLAFRQTDVQTKQARIVVAPVEGGALKATFDLPPAACGLVRWAYGGRGLSYVDDRTGASELWFQPIEGGPPKQLTRFQTGKIFSFAWSSDGAHLAVARGTRDSNLGIVKN